jgi:hypothetical protein
VAEERSPVGAPRRTPLVVAGVVLLVAVGVGLAFLFRDGGDAVRTEGPGEPSPAASVAPETPAFRFRVTARRIEPTTGAGLSERDRRAARRATDAAQALLTRLYVEGFLDPSSWREADYDAAFAVFTRAAASEARRRAGAVTAGPHAGDRYTAIEPAGGTLSLRVLVDRAGAPALVAGVVEFRARALGDPPVAIRSEGSFLLRRGAHGWRIVSFDVVRRDRPREAA